MCIPFAIRALGLGLGLAVAGPGWAGPLSAALDAAWRRDPQALTLEAGGRLDQARHEQARRLLIAPPELEARQWRGDGFSTESSSAEETELDLSLALRWPGERQAALSLAEAEAYGRAAQREARRLELAGELREAAAELLAARAEESLAMRRRALADALAADIAQQVKAGEKAETERMLALGEALAARRAAFDAASRRQRAEGEWAARTGAEPGLPEDAEAPAEAVELEAHPAWLALAAERQRLLAARQAAQADAREAPRLSLGARRERAEAGGPSDTALSLGFSIPLGERVEQGSRRAELDRDLVEVEARLAQLRTRLTTERRQAQSELDTARTLKPLAAEQAELARRQRAEARRALDLGELSLLDYTRLDAQAAEAERGAVLARLAETRAIARLNQAYGKLP